MPSARYFIAIVAPEQVQHEVTAFKNFMADRFGSVVALRSPAHITIYPPFVCDENLVNRMKDVLRRFAAQAPSFSIVLNGFGCFRPRVIYVNSEGSEELIKLHLDCVAVLQHSFSAEKFPSETRPFHPHMTIANRDLKKELFNAAWMEFKDRKYATVFLTTHLSLLRHTGKIWRIEEQFPFLSEK